jgi:predicted N-acyltransferase
MTFLRGAARSSPDGGRHRSPSARPYASEVVTTVTQIPREDWQRLAPIDDPLWTWSFFRAMEQGGIGPDSFSYVIIRSQQRIVAILPACTYQALRLDRIVSDIPHWVLTPLRALGSQLLRHRIMFCGNLNGQGRVLTENPRNQQLNDVIVRAAVDHARENGVTTIVLKDFNSDDLEHLRFALSGHAFFDVAGLPDAVIHVRWSSMDQYVSALPSKPRRNTRRKIRTFTSRDDFRMEVVTNFEHVIEQMIPLYHQVLEKAKFKLDVWTSYMLYALSADTTINAPVVLCWYKDMLVGFLLCLIADAELIVIRIGLDYTVAHDASIYHNLHYRAIETAIQNRCQRINLAQTHYIPKIEMGAKLIARTHAVTHVNPLVRYFLRHFLRRMLIDPSEAGQTITVTSSKHGYVTDSTSMPLNRTGGRSAHALLLRRFLCQG